MKSIHHQGIACKDASTVRQVVAVVLGCTSEANFKKQLALAGKQK